ncbi:FtsB family cell division protein [Romboutsia sp. 1001713B170207_170306_H8]|uniref:FtsB family cell division protein n=1 Tax=Romboutsia sp. 1001713B170207_170306_H8 TaxID=2787112 RepID=UPI0008218B7A|nr:septum formation initiator family protein [Romboutsia sp. 1001713B170207_170306_H8]SCI37815.1 Septum formation initiator [uncultured Clostridium sp.]
MKIQKRFSGQYLGLCIFLGFIGLTMIGGFGFQLVKYKEYSLKISTLNKKLEDADREINNLKAISSSQDESDLEDVARRRLNMVKPNEIVYMTEAETDDK